MFLLKQVVDLSNNALTAILPLMIMALELPHLEADLAVNRWQCDCSVEVFQNVISESWRKKWNAICNKSIGKSVVSLLSEMVPFKQKRDMKNLVSLETMTVPPEARVLIYGIDHPWAVSQKNHWYLTVLLSS